MIIDNEIFLKLLDNLYMCSDTDIECIILKAKYKEWECEYYMWYDKDHFRTEKYMDNDCMGCSVLGEWQQYENSEFQLSLLNEKLSEFEEKHYEMFKDEFEEDDDDDYVDDWEQFGEEVLTRIRL